MAASTMSGAPGRARRPFMRRAVGGAATHAARLVDRVLHPLRRRAAVARLRTLPPPQQVLVMCYGNVCRSPFMAAVLSRTMPGVRVVSAGFVGPGRTPPGEAIDVAATLGEDLSDHRSQLVTTSLVAASDVVVVMDAAQARTVIRRFGGAAERVVIAGDLDPLPIERRQVLDPWGRPRADFERSYARLTRCAEVMARTVRTVSKSS